MRTFSPVLKTLKQLFESSDLVLGNKLEAGLGWGQVGVGRGGAWGAKEYIRSMNVLTKIDVQMCLCSFGLF